MRNLPPPGLRIAHGRRSESGRAAALFSARRNRQRGTAVVIMLAILSVILIYIGTNYSWLYGLERELKLTEQMQLRRLKALSAANTASPASGSLTNAVAPPAPRATPE